MTGRILFPRRPYSRVLNTRRHLRIRSGNKAHPSVEDLALVVLMLVEVAPSSRSHIRTEGLPARSIRCHEPSQMATERRDFHSRAAATTVEISTLKIPFGITIR